MFKIYAMDCKWCKRLYAQLPLLVTKRDMKGIMTKLSEVEAKVTEQNVKLDQIALDVKALKDGAPIPTDPPISAGAETALTDLGTKVTNIRTILDATTTPPVV